MSLAERNHQGYPSEGVTHKNFHTTSSMRAIHMAYEHKPNEGSLFYKGEERKTDRDPSWKGDGIIDLAELGLGTGRAEVWLSIWVNDIKPKGKWLKISISAKTPREEKVEESKPETSFEDDIPF